MEEGYRYGQLSLAVLNKFDRKEWVPRAFCWVYGCINVWTQPLKSSLGPLRRAHELALERGDTDYAKVIAASYCFNSYHCGVPLQEVEEETLNYRQMTDVDVGSITGDFLTAVRFLTGTIYSSENQHINANDIARNGWAYGFLFGEYESAIEVFQSINYQNMHIGTFEVAMVLFFEAMAVFGLARQTKQKKNVLSAQNNLKQLKFWQSSAECNLGHMVALLEAENASLAGKTKVAKQLYIKAIEKSRDAGFLHIEAIAYEKAAIHLHDQKVRDAVMEKKLIEKAIGVYSKWGATSKVEDLRRNVQLA